MIINCPIYIEVDEKFTPEEGRQFTLGMRKYLVDELRKITKGSFSVNWSDYNQKNYTVKILSESEAVSRFGNQITKVKSQPPVVDKK